MHTKQKLDNIKSRLFFYTPAIGWGILIIYFSLMPGGNVPDLLKSIQGFLIHVTIYYLLATLIFFGGSRFKFKAIPPIYFLIALLIIAFMGGLLETIQENYIANRSGEWEDVFANLLGGILAISLWKLFSKR